jgi:hypothetical protein
MAETGTAFEKQFFRERREYVPVGSRKNILFFSVPEKLFSSAVPPYGFSDWITERRNTARSNVRRS